MARALLGHLATSADAVLLAEVTRLRRQVADLEAQVAELQLAALEARPVDTALAADDAEWHAELHAMNELHAMTQEHQADLV